MPQFANYNVPETRIYVDPPELYEIGVKVNASGENIVTEIKQISDIWADLKLGWAGTTASRVRQLTGFSGRIVTPRRCGRRCSTGWAGSRSTIRA